MSEEKKLKEQLGKKDAEIEELDREIKMLKDRLNEKDSHFDDFGRLLVEEKEEDYERFITSLYSRLHTGICEFSLDWKQIERANDAIYNIVGADAEYIREKFGNSFTPFIHPDDKPLVMQKIRHMVNDGVPRGFDCRAYDMGGNIHWLRCWISQVENTEQRRVGLLELTDITEIKNMSEELQQRNQKIPAMVLRIEINTDLTVRYCNDFCTEFFGATFSATGKLFEFVVPEDKNTITALLPAVKRGEDVSCVARFYNAKHEKRWLHIAASCVGTDGVVPEYYCVMLDISEQMTISMELQQEKQKYKAALQGTSDTIFDYDVAKDVLVFYGNPLNPSVSRLNRHIVPRFVSHRLNENLFAAEDVPLVREYLLGGAGGNIEARLCTDKERRNWVWYRAEGDILYDHDRPTRVIGKMKAISDQDHTLYARIAKRLKKDKVSKYAVMRMDVDNFKLINDVCGWLEGDRLLNYCSSLLRERLADKNCVYGRLSGDVFCILMPYEDESELTSFADSIAANLRDYPLDLKVVIHFGIYRVEERNIAVSVMHGWANLAVKTVKGNMMVNYAFFTKDMRSKEIENKNIESQMTGALKNEEFAVYLQPKYNIITNTVVGAEALIRWKHPTKGILYPGEFVPLFEKNRFIVQLDEYVWEQVCMMLRDWINSGYKIVPVSVNVSRLHIYDPNFVQKLKDLLARYCIPKELVVLEFTESVFLDDVGALYRLIKELTDEGFLISSDDFGAGYSSLNMLKTVPLYEVKLDKGFLDETSENEKGKTVMRGVIAMLSNLDVKIIAEGVENREQADFLVSAGCNVAQGFFYSRAVDKPTFEKLAFGT